eukprot:CAMPEP_0197182066 /NCGR_PEP_ID=MMETSP1423-20130617/6155_1 /TAXON_ID=476441 /ORGANISM="Pseudo-nitzschia heimii, Strain UNC1101" /LENGTH=875 /DNA_ID=CAMNT_0042632435 /DNA_START=50 /DNA_END=2677 /DNA_ORIENTATION=-
MNLCGGMVGVTEHELTFLFPDEELSVSSKKKRSSSSQSLASRRDRSTSERYSLRRQSSSSSRHSARSSRGGGAASSQSLTSASTSKVSALNPIAKHDYEKQRTRNRSRPVPFREMKGFSVLTRKLVSGFNLIWINGGGKTQAVNMSTNSDKTYLRIRIRSRDEDESENDGSKGNQRDVKIKVRHIAKIGSETESASKKKSDENQSKRHKSNCFIIKMKSNVCEFNKLKFSAQSLAERDSVLLAIRSLMDQGKHMQEGSLPSKSKPNEFDSRAKEVVGKSPTAIKMIRHKNEKIREDTDGFDIPVPHNFGDDERFRIESRDDNVFERAEDSERVAVDRLNHATEKNSSKRQYDSNRPYNNSSTYKLTTTQNTSNTAKLHRNTSSSWMEKKDIDVDGRKLRKNVDTFSKSRQRRNSLKANSNKQRSRSSRLLEHQRNDLEFDRVTSVINKTTDPTLLEESIKTCQPQALSALKDGNISDLGAEFPTTGPWCTDDVCTVSLKEFADSMTGIFDLKENRDAKGLFATKKNQRAVAEEYISGLLSNNTNMSELLSVKDLWNVAASKHATGKEIKKMRLHNRARSSNGKAIHSSNLRKQMTFQGADTESPLFLQTINSFDDIERKQKYDADDCDLLYYDSDPEGSRERALRKGPRVAMARREETKTQQSMGKRRQALDIIDISRFGLGRKWKVLGQDVLTDIIEAIKNERLTLLWHPTQDDKSNNMPPVCVKVWVESGIYLADGSFLLPKLTWLPAHEKNLEHRVLNVSDKNPGSLDLLDVCRVRECQSIDRRLHPFAHVDRSFIIQTQNGRFMFEAKSKQERGRIVNGLKLVIARLASLLMLKDLRAVDEFFGGNAVPGEAPLWARGHEKNDAVVDFPPA